MDKALQPTRLLYILPCMPSFMQTGSSLASLKIEYLSLSLKNAFSEDNLQPGLGQAAS